MEGREREWGTGPIRAFARKLSLHARGIDQVVTSVWRASSGGSAPERHPPPPPPRRCRGFHVDNGGVGKFTRNERGLLSLTRISDLSPILNLTRWIDRTLKLRVLEVKVHLDELQSGRRWRVPFADQGWGIAFGLANLTEAFASRFPHVALFLATWLGRRWHRWTYPRLNSITLWREQHARERSCDLSRMRLRCSFISTVPIKPVR